MRFGDEAHDGFTAARAAAFALAAAVPIYYALRGGSYDIVVRQEEAIVVWLVAGLGFALGVLPRARPARGAAIPLAAVALLAIWTALGLSWTDSDERTLAELARVLQFGGLALLGFTLVDRTNWRAAAAGLTAAAALISVLALGSRLAPHAFPANEVRRSFHSNRLNYPFHYWNAVAAWSVMAIAMLLSWSACARRVPYRALCLAVVPICGLAVYLTYSRAGAIGSGLAIVVVLVLSPSRWVALLHIAVASAGTGVAILVARDHEQIVQATGSAGAGAVVAVLAAAALVGALVAVVTSGLRADRWRLPRPVARIAVGGGVALLVLIPLTAARGPIANAWDDFRGANQPAKRHPQVERTDPAARLTNLGGTRYFEWRSALRAFKKEPLRGIGAGTFEYWWNRDDGREFVRDAHSLYFESLAELGIPGFLLVVAFLGGLLALAVRARWREAAVAVPAAALAVFLFHAGVDWMWESTAVTVLAALCGAVAAGPLGSPLRDAPRTTRIAVPIVAVVAILVELPGLVSVSAVRDSQAAAKRGDTTEALSRAQDAVDAEPWASTPYVQRGLLEESAGHLHAAAVDLERAARREATNWRPWLLLARVEAERGRVHLALRDFRHARRLRPDSVFFPLPSSR
jgi:tetratricopeptide (TPR) repeat protein